MAWSTPPSPGARRPGRASPWLRRATASTPSSSTRGVRWSGTRSSTRRRYAEPATTSRSSWTCACRLANSTRPQHGVHADHLVDDLGHAQVHRHARQRDRIRAGNPVQPAEQLLYADQPHARVYIVRLLEAILNAT